MSAARQTSMVTMDWRARRFLPVLAYHSFAGARRARDELATAPSSLAEHLARLVNAGYRVVGLTEALRAADQQVVALTIDDGYRDLLDVIPILAEFGAGATLYVPAGHLGGKAGWLPAPESDRALLSAKELRGLAAAGFEIGAHGWAHRALDLADSAQLSTETAAARGRLINEVGTTVTSFAYPFGYSSVKARRAVAAAGYENACVLGHALHRRSADRFAVRRLLVTSGDTGESILRRCQREIVSSRAVVTTALRLPWREYRRLSAGRSPV